MREKLISYIEFLFKDANRDSDELKKQILESALLKYDELLSEGIGEDEAFNTVLADIGEVKAKRTETAVEHSAGDIKKRSVMLSVAVALYILSLIPPILSHRVNEDLGACLMFLMIAVATAMIIYRATAYKNVETVARKVEQIQSPAADGSVVAGALRRVLSGVIWAVGTVLWLLLSLLSGAWHVTWLVFPICLALNNALSAAFNLRK